MDHETLNVILESVFPRYDLLVKGIMPVDEQTCLVDSDRGIKRLRIDTDERRLKRRHAMWEHLAKQGFRRVPRHIRTLYGDAWIKADDQYFTLSDDWDGRVAELTPLDMRLVGRNLAYLHQAAAGLQLGKDVELPKRHSTWLNTFTRAGDDLADRKVKWSELSTRNPLQERFLTHYEWIAEKIGQSVEALVAAKYEDVANRSQQKQEFAVGDYRLSDLRIDNLGRVATLHIDDAIADLPLYDVAKFAHNLLERGEAESARLFLDSYAETAGLSQQDVVIIDAYLTFPHSAYRHLLQYNRLKKGAEEFANRLDQAVFTGQTRHPMLYGSDNIRWS